MPWINGIEPARRLRADLADAVRRENLAPGLFVLLVGDDPASALYVRLKEKAAAEVGVRLTVERGPNLSDEEAVTIVRARNADPAIHGILVQLPLPEGLSTDAVVASIDPEKDVDSFHPENRAALLRGEAKVFSPVHLAVLRLVAETPLRLNGARALLLAKSPVFAEPLAHLLRRAGLFVTTTDRPSPRECAAADLVVTALGTAGTLRGEQFGPEAVIIDVTTARGADGRVVGDLAEESLGPDQWASPVPGGVGPLTIAYLLQNVVEAARRQKNTPA